MNDFNASSPLNDTSGDEVITIGGDESSKERFYNLILWLPFVLIPLSIIFVRVIKLTWKIYRARQIGKENELLKDPLAELGLSLQTDFAKQRKIKRIKREQEDYKAWVENEKAATKRADVEMSTIEESEQGLAGIKQKADVYFAQLRQTRQTWLDKLSPEAVRRFFSATKYGRIWMFFQVFCTTVSIVNYVLLTYSIGREDKKAVKRIDVALAAAFAVDYAIGLYTADDRLRYYFDLSSLADLISIVPPFVYLYVNESTSYVWFLGVLRILRASRILRTYRLVSYQESEVRREFTILGLTFINFLFLSASIINALEVVQSEKDFKPASLRNWHDCLYYIMVTFR